MAVRSARAISPKISAACSRGRDQAEVRCEGAEIGGGNEGEVDLRCRRGFHHLAGGFKFDQFDRQAEALRRLAGQIHRHAERLARPFATAREDRIAEVDGGAQLAGALAWLVMAVSFQPMLRFYRRSPLWGVALPAIGVVYGAATALSAWQHKQGRGGMWKGRAQARMQR